jgi:hypothetical protein
MQHNNTHHGTTKGENMDLNNLTITQLATLSGILAGGGDSLASLGYNGFRIVVLDRGFVYVGDVEQKADTLRISNARNIRAWGTTAGLGA